MATQKDFIVKNGLDVGGDVEAAGSGSFVGLDVTGNVVLGGTVNPKITLNDTSTSNLIHTITSGSDKLQISTDPNQVHASSRIEFLVDATERAQITDVGMDVTGNLTASGNLEVAGNLTVNGTSTTLNVATLDVEDKNITLNFGAGDTSASAGGAGITIQDAVDASTDASILWNATNSAFDFSHEITAPSALTLTSNAPRIFLYEADTTDLNTALFSSGGKFTIRTTTDDDATRTTRLEVSHSTGDIGFYEDNGGTPQVGMHWDYTDGRLGIGGSSICTNPQWELVVGSGVTGGTNGQIFVDATIDGTGDGITIDGDGRSTGDGSLFLIIDKDNNVGMDVDTDGNVGIGTGSSTTAKLLINTQIGDNGGGASTVDYPLVISQEDVGNTIDQGIGAGVGILFKNATNSSSEIGSAIASMRASASDSNTSNELAFFISDNDTTLDEAVRIDVNGNVGIGTDDPDCALDVTRTSGWAEMHLDGASGGDLILKDDGVSYGEVYAGNGHGLVIKSYASQDIYFLTNANATPKMVIESGGNVGIGADPALHKLDVDGAIATRQVRHSIAPTLNLDFANSKQLDPRITFYRDSIATYYDSKGILRYANHNEPRFDHDPVTGESKGLLIEEARSGLNTNTVTINGGYWGFSNATASVKQAVAPDGTYSADGIHANTVNDGHGIFKSFVPAANTYYTLTGYYKRGANRFVSHAWYYNEAAGASNYPTAYYDLDNGTFTHTAGINRGTTMTDVGNGWYRCSLTVLSDGTPGTSSYFYATSATTSGAAAYVGTGAIDTYYWGLQVEIGAFPTSYIPSHTRFASRTSSATHYDENGIIVTVPSNTARYGYEYDGRKWVETGLIIENAATNTVANSDFQEGWAFPNARHSYGNAITAPDGSQIRSVVTNSTYHLIRQSNVFDNTSAGTATLSFWAKAISSTGNESVGFDFGDMAGSAFNSSTSQSITSEWKRFTYTQSWTANQTAHNFLDFTMGNDTEVGVWGVQVETGTVATSYIPTYEVDVTRSADVVTSTAYTREEDDYRINDISDFYNTQGHKGTLYREISFNESLIRASAQRASTSFYSEAPTSGNIILRAVTSPTTPYLDTVGTQSGTQWDLGAGNIVNFNEVQKQSVSFEDNNITGAVNGVSISSDNNAEVPLVTTLRILDANDTTACVRKIVYYPEALTIAEQLALTENN